jgi:RsiW-degrading membrane proteinase PrsW (M82 family)
VSQPNQFDKYSRESPGSSAHYGSVGPSGFADPYGATVQQPWQYQQVGRYGFDPAAPAPSFANTPIQNQHAVWTAPTPPTPKSTGLILAIIGICVLGFVFLAVLIYILIGLGPVALIVSGVVALIPLAVVLLTIRWIDRWEPEPRGALWFAFLWGAAASVAIALIVGLGVEVAVLLASQGTASVGDFFSAVIQAPIVEESAKGLGILILFFAVRRHFDGPIDGLVYGATVAAGFAFTENILYFGSSLIEGGGAGLTFTFFLRGIMSPFAHVMFTACTGLAVGFASRYRGWLPGVGFFFVGLIPAIILHALWNGSSYLVEGLDGFFVIYGVVQVPLFALAITFVVILRKREAKLTRLRLSEYAAAGWFTPEEVMMLSTSSGRRQARTWAKAQGSNKGKLMQQFTQAATKLAFARERLATGRDLIRGQNDEHELLGKIVAIRAELLTVVQPTPQLAPQYQPQPGTATQYQLPVGYQQAAYSPPGQPSFVQPNSGHPGYVPQQPQTQDPLNVYGYSGRR